MLMPAWPRAGPTGGAGVPLPAAMLSLMTPEIFFAIAVVSRNSEFGTGSGKRHPESEPALYRRLPVSLGTCPQNDLFEKCMPPDQLYFWAKFSHGWQPYVTGTCAALLVATIFVSRKAKRCPESSRLPRVAKTLRGVSGLAVFFWVLTQSHWFCAKIAVNRSKCFSNVRDLVTAQSEYAADHDDRFLVAENWAATLRGDKAKLSCPEAKGKVSYAVNLQLAGKPVGRAEFPDQTALIFECGQNTVASIERMALDRHDGTPIVSFLDGRVSPCGSECQKRLLGHSSQGAE